MVTVSGYPIEFDSGMHNTQRYEPMFHLDPAVNVTLTENVGGKAVFTVGDVSLMEGGQGAHATGGPYNQFTGFITAIDVPAKKLTTTLDFQGDVAQSFQELTNVVWTDLAENIERQMLLMLRIFGQALNWQITYDGVNWTEFNNGISIVGLATFTLFSKKEDQVNIRYSTDAGSQQTLEATVASPR